MTSPIVSRLITLSALVFATFGISSTARADTYASYEVGTSSGSLLNLGLTSTGTLVIKPAVCPNNNNCYLTFTPPGQPAVAPYNGTDLTFDPSSGPSSTKQWRQDRHPEGHSIGRAGYSLFHLPAGYPVALIRRPLLRDSGSSAPLSR